MKGLTCSIEETHDVYTVCWSQYFIYEYSSPVQTSSHNILLSTTPLSTLLQLYTLSFWLRVVALGYVHMQMGHDWHKQARIYT